MIDRLRDYPDLFNEWEGERIDEWSDGRVLSEAQIETLTRIDMRTA